MSDNIWFTEKLAIVTWNGALGEAFLMTLVSKKPQRDLSCPTQTKKVNMQLSWGVSEDLEAYKEMHAIPNYILYILLIYI